MSRFERRGLQLCGLKFVNPHRSLAEAHYEEHNQKEVRLYEVNLNRSLLEL